MTSSLDHQTIALSGLFMAAELVQKLANTGEYEETDMRTSLESLFTMNADSVPAVFGGELNMRPGFKRLIEQLSGTNTNPDMQITRYALTLLKIENKLPSGSDAMERIHRGLVEADKLRMHYDTLDSKVIALLAKNYSDNVSPISPKVMVHGNETYLTAEECANSIRACLLAGIRSAVLWRQCGGTRWKLVTGRQRYVNQAKRVVQTH